MNVFTFSGNLGRDCEVRQVGDTSVCNFNVAAKAGYGDKEQTLWVRCALWGKRAESGLVNYLTKGQMVMVSGELSTREHEGKTYLECRVSEVTLAGGRSDSAPPQRTSAPVQSPTAPADDFDDDVPF